jgi:hypothetical protein
LALLEKQNPPQIFEELFLVNLTAVYRKIGGGSVIR